MIIYDTKNDLSAHIRSECISLLQDRLADAIDVMLQSKQAHWNVKGINFIALHKLFDRVHDDLEDGVDLIAERIVQLGGVAEGTSDAVFERSSMPGYPLQLSTAVEHVEALSTSLAAYAQVVRQAIDQCIKSNDANSADIFTEISRSVDKNLWMVEAHSQAPLISSEEQAA
jgi:starvation-inducible DNA-binding protein